MRSAELYSPAAGAFAPTGDLVHSRCEARAVALEDGRVLVVGGFGDGIGDAELFDPNSGSFSLTGPLIEARGAGFTLTRLDDGRVLVAGGDNFSGTIDTAELYDPATNSFAPAGVLTTPRSLHTSTLLADGRVLLAGGGAGFTCLPVAATAELFDPNAGTFTATAGAPVAPLWGHAEARLAGGGVLLAGGEPTCGLSSSAGTRAAQVFDPVSGSFAATGDMLDVHGPGVAATRVPDGRVLVTGGIAGTDPVPTGELFDPQADSFGEGAVMSSRRAFHAQVLLPDGTVLVAGGEQSISGVTASADIFDAPSLPVLEARVDVLPDTLNLKSEGRFITMFIGVPGHRPGEIDARSIRLRIGGVGSLAPIAGSRGIGDHDGDGVGDLMLKFSRAQVVALAPVGHAVPFEATGALKDGTPLAGADLVRVICPGHGTCGSAGPHSRGPH
jgi:hypothetical protein